MLNMNTVVLGGYVGQDPTMNTYAGKHKLTLRLATTEIWYDDRGDKREKTDWHEIVYWGKTVPQLAKMIRSGSALMIRGKVRCDEYTHEGVKKWRNYIQAAEICLADKQQSNEPAGDDYDRGPDEYYQEPPQPQREPQRAPQPQREPQRAPLPNDPRGRR